MKQDPFDSLPHFSWRGIKVPIIGRRRTFSHQEVTHQIQYASGEIVEITVSNNWRFDYTLPFREGIDKGGYGALFTKRLKDFQAAFEDRLPGELIDPVHGSIVARPISFSESLDASRRDGVEVDVAFVEHKTSGELRPNVPFAPSNESLVTDARAIDNQVALQTWEGDEPEDLADGGINPIDALTSVIRQADRVNQRNKAIFEDTARRLHALEDAVDDSGDSSLVPIKVNARKARLDVMRAKARERSEGKQTKLFRLPTDMAPTDVASLVKMSLYDFVVLNPFVANDTLILQGTVVRYYA